MSTNDNASVIPSITGPDSLVDLSHLRDIAGDEPDGIKSLLELYFRTTWQLIEKIDNALERKDLGSLGREAHSGGGSSAMLGLTAVVGPFRAMEQLAVVGDADKIVPCLADVKLKLKAVHQYLETTLHLALPFMLD